MHSLPLPFSPFPPLPTSPPSGEWGSTWHVSAAGRPFSSRAFESACVKVFGEKGSLAGHDYALLSRSEAALCLMAVSAAQRRLTGGGLAWQCRAGIRGGAGLETGLGWFMDFRRLD